jgi:hypothetical protein
MKTSTKASIALLVCFMFITLAIGMGVLAAASAIWGPPSGPATATTVTLPLSLSAVTWTDLTTGSGSDPANFNTGDSITLAATISPTTTHTQTVTFYYTNIADPSSDTPIGSNPVTDLVSAGIGTGTASASCSWVVPAAGTYYFIAEIASPT